LVSIINLIIFYALRYLTGIHLHCRFNLTDNGHSFLAISPWLHDATKRSIVFYSLWSANWFELLDATLWSKWLHP